MEDGPSLGLPISMSFPYVQKKSDKQELPKMPKHQYSCMEPLDNVVVGILVDSVGIDKCLSIERIEEKTWQ